MERAGLAAIVGADNCALAAPKKASDSSQCHGWQQLWMTWVSDVAKEEKNVLWRGEEHLGNMCFTSLLIASKMRQYDTVWWKTHTHTHISIFYNYCICMLVARSWSFPGMVRDSSTSSASKCCWCWCRCGAGWCRWWWCWCCNLEVTVRRLLDQFHDCVVTLINQVSIAELFKSCRSQRWACRQCRCFLKTSWEPNHFIGKLEHEL